MKIQNQTDTKLTHRDLMIYIRNCKCYWKLRGGVSGEGNEDHLQAGGTGLGPEESVDGDRQKWRGRTCPCRVNKDVDRNITGQGRVPTR